METFIRQFVFSSYEQTEKMLNCVTVYADTVSPAIVVKSIINYCS